MCKKYKKKTVTVLNYNSMYVVTLWCAAVFESTHFHASASKKEVALWGVKRQVNPFIMIDENCIRTNHGWVRFIPDDIIVDIHLYTQ